MRSHVLLPLYSRRHAGWQGIVALQWREPREPGPAERLLYEFLATTLSESIAAERTMRAYQDSLGANEALLRRAEVALQESQRQSTMLRTLLDHLPLAVIVVRVLDGQMELIQTAGQETVFVGKPGDPLDPSAFTAYAPGAPEPLPPHELAGVRALMTGQTCRQELEIPRPDGTRALIDCTATPMHYEGDPAIHLVLLYNDVTEHRRAERERMVAQDELLRVQALALTERSTPLIPIREDVLIMPLVGAIDEERGRQIIDTLVNLGGRAGVKAAIIDVTGVHNLDTAAARALIGAAQALRLRGVRSILTGIQSNAAMTLVGLGIDFSAIAVRGTLQDGVALATRG
jgi:anti-anti-sigma regulatory factor